MKAPEIIRTTVRLQDANAAQALSIIFAGGLVDILIVDDEPLIAETTAAICILHGYSATAFANPEKALASVGLYSPNLLIVDLKMPSLTGFEVANRVRLSCPECGIIVITGLGDISGFEAGSLPFSVLYKPVSVGDLLSTIRLYFPERN